MQFKDGADVISKDGQRIGVIDRVVINPQTKKITHVVVRKGLLFTEDKVIPLDWFSAATDDQAVLDADHGDVESLPPFEVVHYRPWESLEADTNYPAGAARPFYWYPPADLNWWGHPGYRAHFGFSEPPYAVDRQVPEGTVALQEGAEVISADNEYVGDVERVLADPDTQHVTHLVVASGLIFKSKKLVPSAWVESMGDKTVYLSVSADFLDDLANYED